MDWSAHQLGSGMSEFRGTQLTFCFPSCPCGSPWSGCLEQAFLLCVWVCLLRVWSCVCLAWTEGHLLPRAPRLPTRRWCAAHPTCLRSVGPGEEVSGPAVGSEPQRREV